MQINKDNYECHDENKVFELCIESILGTRDDQQDSAAYELKYDEGIVSVCDGMGGHSGGKLASSIAAETMIKTYNEKYPVPNIPEMLTDSIDVLDEAVCRLKKEGGEKMSAGTTLTAVIIQKHNLHWASVGDSRIYIFRNEELAQATKDHNYKMRLDEQLQNNEINSVEYDKLISKGESLISYIGMGGIELKDINTTPLQVFPGDRILLTTDGMFKILSDDQIARILSNFNNNKEALTALMKKVQHNAKNKSIDNTTAALIKIK
jgi:PPM family protein phosphatase